MTTAKHNLNVQKWITALSIILFITKIIAYYLTHSLSILTDALESIVNVVAGLIGLYSLYIASQPSDEAHPYGHGKAEFVSAAIEGTLIVAAGVIIIYKSVINFIEPATMGTLDTGLILVALTAVLNYLAGYICLRIGTKNRSLALQASGKHLQTDTYSTLAIIAGLLLILFTGYVWLDPVIALIMGIFIMFNGYRIVRQSLAGIMDEQDMKMLTEIIHTLNKNRKPNWIDLHNLRLIKYGTGLHIDCHLTIPWYLNVHEAHTEIDSLTNLIRENFGEAVEFFVHTDGCLPFSCKICNKEKCPVRQHEFEQYVDWSLGNLLSNQKHQLKPIALQ